MSPAAIVEIVMVLAVLIGLPILCYLDPAGHYAAEVKRRQS
jgi:hypothetical protein